MNWFRKIPLSAPTILRMAWSNWLNRMRYLARLFNAYTFVAFEAAIDAAAVNQFKASASFLSVYFFSVRGRYICETSSVLQFLNRLHLAPESIFPSFLLNIIVSEKIVNEGFTVQQKCNFAMPLPRYNRDMIISTAIHRFVRYLTNHILPQRVMRVNNWFSLLLPTTALSGPILYVKIASKFWQ